MAKLLDKAFGTGRDRWSNALIAGIGLGFILFLVGIFSQALGFKPGEIVAVIGAALFVFFYGAALGS